MSERKQRNYGYVRPQQRPKTPHSSRTQPARAKKPVRKKKPNHTKIVQPNSGVIFRILAFPFKIIGALLLLLWSLIQKIFKKRKKKGKRKKAFHKIAFTQLIRLGALGAVGGAIFLVAIFGWYGRDLPNPDKLLDKETSQSTKIYDRTGEHKLYEIFADEKRTLVPLEELPQDLINALIATEDTSFYEHHGIRPLSIARSIVFGLAGQGRIGGGASTITQQLVKNVMLTHERRISRKIKEIILALQLERKYTKEQILQIYFNEIGYGSTNYGVEAAAQSYFRKSVRDVTLAEAATLAGFPQQPTTFLNNPEALKNRRNLVLYRMFAEGFITEEEKDAAQAEPLEIKSRVNNIKAPHFVLYVKEQLVERYGEQLVETGGLNVITTLDWEKQEAAEAVMNTVGTDVLAAADANNAALVAMNPDTAEILTMVGSKDFFDQSIQGQFNVITLGKRQPGSSFKPILYTAAFEKGYTPETVVFDVTTNFAQPGRRPYVPANYDLLERGPVTFRQSLQGSLNIPAVKAAYLVGNNEGVDFAERLGYSTFESRNFGLSLVLGGGAVLPLEHARAYTIFANGGTKRDPVSILRVEDSDGKILDEWKREKGKRVIEKEITDTISNVLSDDEARAYLFGSGGVLTLPDRPVAAKTGTTNNYVDAWTAGYTPQLVTVVWAGNTDNTPMRRGYGGSRVAAPIWQAFMREAHKNIPVQTFSPAPEIKTDKAALRGSHGGGVTIKVNRITGNLANSTTPEKLVVERTYTQPHSLLHYVIKDDPQGPIPEDPSIDPQYAIWEQAIQDWVTRKQEEDENWEISFEEPPSDFDDAEDLAFIPTLEVLSPAVSTTLVSRELETDIRVSAPRGIKQVRYFVDGRLIDIVTAHPFNLRAYDRYLESGEHVLTVMAEDDMGIYIEEDIPFVFEGPPEPPSVTWEKTRLNLQNDDFPNTMRLDSFKTNELAAVKIYRERINEDEAETDQGSTRVFHQEIDSLKELPNGGLALVLNRVPEGSWRLVIEIEEKDGDVRETDVLELEVE